MTAQGMNRFAIVRYDGQAETMKDGMSYFDVLALIYREHQSAGGNWNAPKMLLHNGKVVVEDNLRDLAWNYGRDLYDNTQAAVTATAKAHTPEWLA